MVAVTVTVLNTYIFNMKLSSFNVWLRMHTVEPFQNKALFFFFWSFLFNLSFEFLMSMVIQLMLVFDLIWLFLLCFALRFFALPFRFQIFWCVIYVWYIHFAMILLLLKLSSLVFWALYFKLRLNSMNWIFNFWLSTRTLACMFNHLTWCEYDINMSTTYMLYHYTLCSMLNA